MAQNPPVYPIITITITITYLLCISVTYIVAFGILDKYFKARKFLMLTVSFSLLWLLFIALVYLNEFQLEGIIYSISPAKLSISTYLNEVSWHFMKYCLFGAGLFYANNLLSKERMIQQLENEAKERVYEARLVSAEKEKLEFQNAYLRAKINPHFLFNTLTAFHQTLQECNQVAADAMIEYSELMRYELEGSTELDELVLVSREIKNMERLIRIYHFQSSELQFIRFDKPVRVGGRMPPLIFLTVLENALNYGDISDPKRPLEISIYADDADQLIFRISNKKLTDETIKGTGVGMYFVQNSLQRAFGPDYSLKVEESEAEYSLEIKFML